MIILRDYQDDIISRCVDLFRSGAESGIVVAPTGSGKTALTAEMLRRAAEKGNRSLFVVHRKELIDQSIQAFAKIGLRHGVIAAGYPSCPSALVQIAGVQSLVRRLGRIQVPRLIVWDEAHHCAAGTWQDTYRAFPKAKHIGLTATPERLDGKGLRNWFKEMILGPTVQDLIQRKFLSDYRCFAPPGINIEGIGIRAGDYAADQLAAAADRPTITGSALDHYRRHAAGKRAIVFCCSIQHSLHVAAGFAAAGIPSAHVDGETPKFARDQAMQDFRDGKLRVLSNVNLFGEGVDVPGIECVILLRPTKSLGMYLQQVGRALRPAEGKTHAIILDHAGNTERHGLCDELHHWSLDGRAKEADESAAGPIRVRTCPMCFAVQRFGSPSCYSCGSPFPVKDRQVDHKDGDLVEIDPAVLAARRIQRKREQAYAGTLEELIDIGKERGYRNPWAWARIVFSRRQAKKLTSPPVQREMPL